MTTGINTIRLFLHAAAASLLVWPCAAQTRDPVSESIQLMSGTAGMAVSTAVSPTSGLVTFMRADANAPIRVDLPGPPEEKARQFLADYGVAFGVAAPGALQTLRAGTDDLGMDHVRFRQAFRGIPVTGGEIGVHLRGNGVVAVHGKTLPDFSAVSTKPVLSAAEARKRAREAVAARSTVDLTDVAFSEPRLEIFNRGLLEGWDAPTRLAWFVEARRIDLREYIWVDAELGLILLQFSQLTDALSRSIHDADDPSDGVFGDLPGLLVRSEGDSPTGDTDVDAAYAYSGDTYDYFFNEHARDSYDGAGAELISTVRFCPDAIACPFANAFWNGAQMVYGDGFPVADDVDAHELTHAVTEHTANLFYYMQSGALNESFSDIFGETVDLANSGGTDTPAVRWEMGEDVPGFGAIRNMMDPTLYGDPGKMSDPEFVCTTSGTDPSADRGGVHSNSGVPNHAYALMVDGASYNGFTVNGIGPTKAGKIQYRVLSEYLLSASDFLDYYHAVQQACSDLIGTAGITGADCGEVRKALDAVEMGEPWPCTLAQSLEVPRCGDGETPPDTLFFDDFEELAGGDVNSPALLTFWDQQLLVPDPNFPGVGHWNVCCLGPFSSSGSGNLWGYDLFFTADSALAMNTDVSIPAGGAFLTFNHAYGFEDSHDGGVVEYSTDGGSNWHDAGPLIAAGAAYNGTIDDATGNPLGGRNAFVGDSFGYTTSQLDLSSLSNEHVRFRFRMGTNVSIDDYGWFIDEFHVFTASLTLTSGTINDIQVYEGCTKITAGGTYSVGPSGVVTMLAPAVALTQGFSVSSGGTLKIDNN